MVEITVKKSEDQGQHRFAFTQVFHFENKINGKVNQHMMQSDIAHVIAKLRLENGFSWEDVEKCVKIKDVTNNKEITIKSFIDGHKNLIMAQEKAIESTADSNEFLLGTNDF